MESENCKVTVIVCTYNPNREKLFSTIDSILRQNNISYEIIVTDDGSKENYQEEIKQYFASRDRVNYQCISREANVGTVKNCYEAVEKASGKYIKLISPGDELIGDNVLSEWVEFLENSKKEWSFGDVICYYLKGQEKNFVARKRQPIDVNCYINGNEKKCRRNYVIYGDPCNGAATLVKRDLMHKYFSRIVGQVIYAEDKIYTQLMYENIMPAYYHKKVILYEVGTGISTSGNIEWIKKIQADAKKSDEIMLQNSIDKDSFQKKVEKIFRRKKYTTNKLKKLFYIVSLPGNLIFTVRRHWFAPKTETVYEEK